MSSARTSMYLCGEREREDNVFLCLLLLLLLLLVSKH